MKAENHYISIFLLTIALLLLGKKVGAGELKPDKKQEKTYRDSLLTVVETTTHAKEKLVALSELARLNWQTPAETYYRQQQAKIALETDSFTYFYQAASELGRYYCNANNRDSLKLWGDKVDSIAKIRKETPNATFDFLNYYCRYYLRNGDYELAMNEAVCLQMLSEEADNPKAAISSQEYLGLIYLVIGRDRDAEQAFEKGLALLKQQQPPMPDYEIQLMSYLFISYLRLQELDKMRTGLDYFAWLLQQMKEEQALHLKWANYPFKEKYAVLHSYYINLYVAEKNGPEATEAVQKASSYVEDKPSPYLTSIYNLALARYYFFLKDYPRALAEINKTLAADYSIETLELKINIYEAWGKKDEALAIHAELLDFIKQTNITAFTRQIDQLQTLHNLNEKKMQEQKLLLQKEKLSQKQKQLTASLIFTSVLLILIYLLIRYALHTRRLKIDLQKERSELIETSRKLRIAKEQAEVSNRMKTSFVANMNHEVRTPLNAIVGFSDLLADADEEERQFYIRVIHENTYLLLKLVDDILDLSLMESGRFNLNPSDTDIYTCCQHALNNIRSKVHPGVQLDFTYSDHPFILKTDPQRLQQLLQNLLGNAAKFTEEGKIVLAYHIDQIRQQVVFSVTDTGCGISPEQQETIFKRFEKLDDFKQGAGLGLVISRKIADYLGGSLTVDPTYTRGACFVFTHPFFDQPPV